MIPREILSKFEQKYPNEARLFKAIFIPKEKKMNETFYQLYKSGRDIVEEFRHKKLDRIFREFVDMQEHIANNYDKANPDCYDRWRKEFFEAKGEVCEDVE